MKDNINSIFFNTKYYTFVFVFALSLAASEAFAQLNALDYRLQKRPKLEKFDSNKIFEHTFVSGSVGMQFNLLNSSDNRDLGPQVKYYFGKWFTPVIGARFGMDMSILYDYGKKTHALYGFNLDYLANISAFAVGYNPDRLFELYGIVGATYKRSFRYGYGTDMYGAHAGLQANFNLSPMVNLFVEPMVTIANDGYNEEYLDRHFDILPEITVGVTYKMVPFTRRKTTLFDKTPFRNNLFFSAAVGAERVVSRLMTIPEFKNWFGPMGMIAFGGWFSPIHGIRLSAVGGSTSYTPEYPISGDNQLGSAAARLDYLINYSAAFGGYNEKRLFELIGTYGLEMAFSGQSDARWKMSAGLGLGLQGRFRINSTLDLFMEPRISFYTKNYTNGDNNRYDGVASMLFGVTYHSPGADYRKNNTDFVQKSKADNMFVSFSGGVGGTLARIDESLSLSQNIAARFDIALGKWITPVSGIRITGGSVLFGTKDAKGNYNRARALNLGVDYLFNMTNFLCGYQDDRFFEFIVGAGASAFYHHTTFYPAFQAELQTKFNLKRNWSLYVEPQALWVIPRGVITNSVATRKSLIMTANIGASYTMRGYDPASYHKFKEEEDSKIFISLAGGFGGVIDNRLFDTTNKRISPAGRLSIGKWFSPLGGWRVTAMSEKLRNVNKNSITHGGLEAEVMFNIMNAATGYRDDRIFDLNANAGVHAGFSIVQRHMRFIPGFTGSLQASVKVMPKFRLFVEPQLAIYLNKFDGENRQKSVGMVYIGATYTISKRDRLENVKENGNVENPNFISLSGGAGFYGNTLMSPLGGFKDKLVYSGAVTYGHWFTPIHGMKINGEYTHINRIYEVNAPEHDIAAVRADYMLNVTSLVRGYDPDHLFDFIPFVGAGVAFPLKEASSTYKATATYTLAFGVQAKFNVSKQFDIFIEPKGVFLGNKIDGYRSSAGFDATATLMAGVSYKF